MTAKVIISAASALVLAGCGGGGSSSTMGPLVKWAEPNFKSWNMEPGEGFAAQGESIEVNLTTTFMNGGSTDVQSVDAHEVQLSGVMGSANPELLTSVKLESTSGTTLTYTLGISSSTNFSNLTEFISAVDNNRGDILDFSFALSGGSTPSYMMFGEWEKYDANFNPTQIGYFAVGSITPATSMPLSGSASYSGDAMGRYFESGGFEDFTGSVNATASFGSLNPTMNFTLSGSTMSQPMINVAGGLSITNPTSSFAGNVGGDMLGQVSGKFYGPQAQEIGGTFNLTNGLNGRLVGSFGAKQQ
jgi:hypothetical protein